MLVQSALGGALSKQSKHDILPPRHGGYGVMVTQQVVVLLSWVRSPLATPRKNPSFPGIFTWPRGASTKIYALYAAIPIEIAGIHVAQPLYEEFCSCRKT